MTINSALMNFGPIIAELRECVCDALATAGRAVCRCDDTPSAAPIWDACDCECTSGDGRGQLLVYSTGATPSVSPPNPTAGDPHNDAKCGPNYLVAPLVIAIGRGACEWKGRTPFQLLHDDASMIRQAVGCCLQEMRSDRTILRFGVGATTFAPEQGGCIGSELAAWVAIGHCLCPPDLPASE